MPWELAGHYPHTESIANNDSGNLHKQTPGKLAMPTLLFPCIQPLVCSGINYYFSLITLFCYFNRQFTWAFRPVLELYAIREVPTVGYLNSGDSNLMKIEINFLCFYLD